MTKHRIILVSVVFFSLTVLTVQTLPQASISNRTVKPPDAERLRNMTKEERKKEFAKRREQLKLYSERLRNMTDAERKKEFAKRRRQKKLESEQRRKEHEEERRRWELGREQRRLDREQRYKEFQKRVAEMKKEFLREKYALRPTEEQWKIIKPKLEKVQRLRNQARSTVGVFLTSSSGSGTSSRDSRSANLPNWQWKISWKDKAPAELTEAQKIANELMDLVDNKNTTAEEFKQKMDTLRKSRSKLENIKRQLSEAQQELREVLTTRQEAALVLKKWL